MWRHIAGSVTGPSHERTGAPCQDSHVVRFLSARGEDHCVACVADGAGSGEHSHDGSRLACESIAESATERFERDGSFTSVDEATVGDWCTDARDRIVQLAESRGHASRDYATTLCVALVSPTGTAFFQIGDGVIVARRNGVFGVVFWPASGEYANSTDFLTGENYRDRLRFSSAEGPFADLALMTDGVERLALSFESLTAHPPFFQPLFDALRAADDPEPLNAELARFLRSESVTSRSDDDKTVVLLAEPAAR
ncbi:MAG: PP2C family serine/threonine-protein phosphatase [Planctomycetota bacterium]